MALAWAAPASAAPLPVPASRPALVALPLRATAIAGDGRVVWLAAGRVVVGIDAPTARLLPATVPLATGQELLADGTRAWIADPGAGALTVPGAGTLRPAVPPVVATVAPIARAGARLWGLAPGADVLRGTTLGVGTRRDVVLGGSVVRAAAADRTALWLLAARPGSRARLERHDPVTGALLRTTRLSARAVTGTVAAGRGVAWVLPGNRQLLRVGRDGRAHRVRPGVAAVAVRDRDLWVLAAGRRELLRLDPRTGRVRRRVRTGVRLATAMVFAGRDLWVLSASGRQVLRVPRA